jgi:hypothetical protein
MKNTELNTIFSIYLLYPIDRDDEDNFYRLLQRYINIGTEIYAYLLDWEKMDGFPKFRLYVPADHEIFINSAYKSGFITAEEIQNINCKIIETCDLLISFGGRVLGATEVDYATQKGVAIYSMPDLSPIALDALKLAVRFIIRAKE